MKVDHAWRYYKHFVRIKLSGYKCFVTPFLCWLCKGEGLSGCPTFSVPCMFQACECSDHRFWIISLLILLLLVRRLFSGSLTPTVLKNEVPTQPVPFRSKSIIGTRSIEPASPVSNTSLKRFHFVCNKMPINILHSKIKINLIRSLNFLFFSLCLCEEL